MKKVTFVIIALLIIVPTIIPNLVNAEEREEHIISTWSGTYYALGPSSYSFSMQPLILDEIKNNYPESILFNLTFIPTYHIKGHDFETRDYYIEGQEITAVMCYIRKLNKNTILSNVTLTVICPNGSVYRTISFLEDNFTGTNTLEVDLLDNKPIIFYPKGLWKIRLNFESDKECLIWRYVGNNYYQTFKPTRSQHEKLKKVIFYDTYREEIPVITLSEALEVSSTRYTAMQTDYLNKSADAQMESSIAQKNLTDVTYKSLQKINEGSNLALIASFLLVIFTLLYVSVVFLDYRYKKTLQKKEIIYERLKGLYSPLYTNIQSTYFLTNRQYKTLSFKRAPPGRTQSQEKEEFDRLIRNNLHLATKPLASKLTNIYGVSSRRVTNVEASRIVSMVETVYKNLNKELKELDLPLKKRISRFVKKHN